MSADARQPRAGREACVRRMRMNRRVGVAGAALAVLLASFNGGIMAAQRQPPGTQPPTASTHRAVLDRYCVSCHNERNKNNAGRLALDSADLSAVPAHPEV